MTYIEVAVAKHHTGRKFFTYKADISVDVGAIVKLEYGKKITYGVVVGVVRQPTFTTKHILQVINYSIPKIYLDLMTWMFDFYPDDWGSITQLFIPAKFLINGVAQKPAIIDGKSNPLHIANAEQKNALLKIKKTTNKRVLLHGDTGTGKTRVFTELSQQTIANGKSVLILTPEIGLTPQLLNDISQYVNAPILLTHSAKSESERRKVWEYANQNKKPAVYIGPRSAIFLPIKSLGLIVMDEAHDDSYKQSQPPKYQTMHVASKLAELSKSMLILSTATPNIQDYYIAKNRDYTIVRMQTKAAGTHKHNIELVDITNRDNFTKSPYLSNQLLQAIQISLDNNEQIMLFLNRRGSARLVQCEDCGWQALCPNCAVPLTYHHDSFIMLCHLCGHQQLTITNCPECQSANIHFKSIGTKSLVEHVQKLFTNAKIMRFDADSSKSEQLHNNIEELKKNNIDILIGTQLISKGIDLPSLGLVGVINADNGLNLPDYRAEEITFQQLYQVTGRAARGHRLNKSFIQSRVPSHPVMQAVLEQNWSNFYSYELAKRRQFNYPPFSYIAEFKITKNKLEATEKECQKIYDYLIEKYKNNLQLLGPSPSFYEQRGGQYSWQIIAKSSKRSLLVNIARDLPQTWTYNIDPTSLL